MLNAILAGVTAVLWGLSYGLFFGRDIRRWWRTRHQRRAEAVAARARAVQAYVAWTRNIPPPRSRVAVMPTVPTPVRTGVVLAFPRSRQRRRR